MRRIGDEEEWEGRRTLIAHCPPMSISPWLSMRGSGYGARRRLWALFLELAAVLGFMYNQVVCSDILVESQQQQMEE